MRTLAKRRSDGIAPRITSGGETPAQPKWRCTWASPAYQPSGTGRMPSIAKDVPETSNVPARVRVDRLRLRVIETSWRSNPHRPRFGADPRNTQVRVASPRTRDPDDATDLG